MTRFFRFGSALVAKGPVIRPVTARRIDGRYAVRQSPLELRLSLQLSCNALPGVRRSAAQHKNIHSLTCAAITDEQRHRICMVAGSRRVCEDGAGVPRKSG